MIHVSFTHNHRKRDGIPFAIIVSSGSNVCCSVSDDLEQILAAEFLLFWFFHQAIFSKSHFKVSNQKNHGSEVVWFDW